MYCVWQMCLQTHAFFLDPKKKIYIFGSLSYFSFSLLMLLQKKYVSKLIINNRIPFIFQIDIIHNCNNKNNYVFMLKIENKLDPFILFPPKNINKSSIFISFQFLSFFVVIIIFRNNRNKENKKKYSKINLLSFWSIVNV